MGANSYLSSFARHSQPGRATGGKDDTSLPSLQVYRGLPKYSIILNMQFPQAPTSPWALSVVLKHYLDTPRVAHEFSPLDRLAVQDFAQTSQLIDSRQPKKGPDETTDRLTSDI